MISPRWISLLLISGLLFPSLEARAQSVGVSGSAGSTDQSLPDQGQSDLDGQRRGGKRKGKKQGKKRGKKKGKKQGKRKGKKKGKKGGKRHKREGQRGGRGGVGR